MIINQNMEINISAPWRLVQHRLTKSPWRSKVSSIWRPQTEKVELFIKRKSKFSPSKYDLMMEFYPQKTLLNFKRIRGREKAFSQRKMSMCETQQHIEMICRQDKFRVNFLLSRHKPSLEMLQSKMEMEMEEKVSCSSTYQLKWWQQYPNSSSGWLRLPHYERYTDIGLHHLPANGYKWIR